METEMMWTQEEEINYLNTKVENLNREINRLETENRKLRSELDSAKFQIEHELEPRLKREGRMYDLWVLDPER